MKNDKHKQHQIGQSGSPSSDFDAASHRHTGRSHSHNHNHVHGHMHSHGHRSNSARKRRGKIFSSEQLQLVLLALIGKNPSHGYDLIREVDARSNNAYVPSAGMVYPILSLLVEMGLTEVEETADAKKIFTVTEAGKQIIEEKSDALERLFGALEQLAEKRTRIDAPPVVRAMSNLKNAIGVRLSQDGIDEDTIFAVTDLIDDAARKIERLK